MKLRRDAAPDLPAASGTFVHGDSRTSRAADGHGMLGELLVGAQLISHAQLAEALLQQSGTGKRIGVTFSWSWAPSASATWPTPCRTSSTSPWSTFPNRHHRPRPSRSARERRSSPPGDPDRSRRKRDHHRRGRSERRDPGAPRQRLGRLVRLVIAPRSDVQRAIDTAYRALGNIERSSGPSRRRSRSASPRRHHRGDRSR